MLDKDPLEDIRKTHSIRYVMKHGEILEGLRLARRGHVRSTAPRPTHGKPPRRRSSDDAAPARVYRTPVKDHFGQGYVVRQWRISASAVGSASGAVFGTDAARWPHRAADLT